MANTDKMEVYTIATILLGRVYTRGRAKQDILVSTRTDSYYPSVTSPSAGLQ